jgi:hypothetical protein
VAGFWQCGQLLSVPARSLFRTVSYRPLCEQTCRSNARCRRIFPNSRVSANVRPFGAWVSGNLQPQPLHSYPLSATRCRNARLNLPPRNLYSFSRSLAASHAKGRLPMTTKRIMSLVCRIFLSLTFLTLIPLDVFSAATCTGSDPCNACKNCRYCRHCAKEGGKCGVCHSHLNHDRLPGGFIAN